MQLMALSTEQRLKDIQQRRGDTRRIIHHDAARYTTNRTSSDKGDAMAAPEAPDQALLPVRVFLTLPPTGISTRSATS